jgi:hypothetical protein
MNRVGNVLKSGETGIHSKHENSPSASAALLLLLALAAFVFIKYRRAAPRDRPGGAASATAAEGVSPGANRVLALDGKTGFMRVADSPSLQTLTNAMTIEVWFKALSFYPRPGSVNSIFRKDTTGGEQNFFLRFRISQGGPMVELASGNKNGILTAASDSQPGRW